MSDLPRRTLGASGVEVAAVGLGGNTFGPPRLDAAATDRVVGAALDLGVDFVDTAIVYGQGRSEELLGAALGARRDEMTIATKGNFFALGDEAPADRLRSQAEESLRKLGTDRIDLYQVHFPDDSVPVDELAAVLAELVESGKVRAVGVCNYAGWRIADTVAALERAGGPPLATVQDYHHLLARQVEAEVLPACRSAGSSLLPYHPLAGGFLTGKYRPGEPPPEGTRGAAGSPIITAVSTEQNWERLAALEAFAAARGRSVGALAVAWLLSHQEVACVIAGVSNPEQLAANVAAASWTLTPDELAELDAVSPPPPSPERPPYA